MLGILCGLNSEERIALKIPGAIVACGAARPHKSYELAEELVAKGATRLMSFGTAGSLDPSVRLGDVIIGTRVVSSKASWDCDAVWGQELQRRIPYAKRGAVYGSDVMVLTASMKASLHQSMGCAIVDMESQCLAEVAAQAHLPLIVVRAVCDDALMNVPPFVMAAIGEDGSTSGLRAVAHLLKHPSQTGDLFRVTHGFAKALSALRKAKDQAGE